MFNNYFHMQNRNGAYIPINYSNLLLWINADDTDKYALDGSFRIDTIYDQSSYGRDVTYRQNNKGTISDFYTTDKKCFSFAGLSNYWFSIIDEPVGNLEIYAVCYYGYASTGINYFLWEPAATTAGYQVRVGLWAPTGEDSPYKIRDFGIEVRSPDVNPLWRELVAVVDNNQKLTPKAYTFNNSALYVNGATPPFYGNSGSIGIGMDLGQLGNYGEDTPILYLAELLVYNTELSSSDRLSLILDLGAKYNL